MSKQYKRNTWQEGGAETIVRFGGDSNGGWALADRYDAAIFEIVRHYKSYGFNIKAQDRTINGGSIYNFKPDAYTKPPYVIDSRPGKSTGYNINSMVSDGATDVIMSFSGSDTDAGRTDANPSGLNVLGEEQLDVKIAIRDYAELNNVNILFTDAAPRKTDISLNATVKEVADNHQLTNLNIMPLFADTSDPTNNNLGFASDFQDEIHWSPSGQLGRFVTSHINRIDEHYDLLEDVYTIDSDVQCDNNDLLIIDGIAQIIDGEFQRLV